MKHYWINIDKSTDRRELMERQLSGKRIENTRILAETPDTIKGYTIHRNENSLETAEEISCVISHLKAIKQGYDDGEEHFCVLEDDMVITKLDFVCIFNHLQLAEEEEAAPFDVLQLFTNGHPCIIQMFNDNVDGPHGFKKFIKKRDGNYPSTGYYLVSRKGAKNILDKFVKSPTEFDLSCSHWSAADNILYEPFSSYILTYPIAMSDTRHISTIHESHTKNHEIANRFIDHIWDKNNQLPYLTSIM